MKTTGYQQPNAKIFAALGKSGYFTNFKVTLPANQKITKSGALVEVQVIVTGSFDAKIETLQKLSIGAIAAGSWGQNSAMPVLTSILNHSGTGAPCPLVFRKLIILATGVDLDLAEGEDVIVPFTFSTAGFNVSVNGASWNTPPTGTF